MLASNLKQVFSDKRMTLYNNSSLIWNHNCPRTSRADWRWSTTASSEWWSCRFLWARCRFRQTDLAWKRWRPPRKRLRQQQQHSKVVSNFIAFCWQFCLPWRIPDGNQYIWDWQAFFVQNQVAATRAKSRKNEFWHSKWVSASLMGSFNVNLDLFVTMNENKQT